MTPLFTPAKIIVNSGAYLEGDFILKDGSKSDCFIDLGRVSNGVSLHHLVLHLTEAMWQLFPNSEVLVGPPYKAIPLVVLLSAQTGIPFDYYRKERKEHGEGGDWVTKALQPGMRALIVDDVCTAGTAKREAIDRVRAAGAAPMGILVVVDRTPQEGSQSVDGIPLFSITTLSQVKEAYRQLRKQGN